MEFAATTRKALLPLALVGLSASTYAFNDFLFSRLIGYTIVASKTIAGYMDRDGRTGTDFQGCNYGRVIVFSDNTVLTCSEYNYEYSYQPTAILLVKGSSIKMIVESNIFDMQLQ
jgi:hypothetical protein